ncbi:hypothetical protein [Bifidobacterium pseudocatenulatum]|uniref:hypothetical protein n=1 Tax=Bifidobacterium pseudocatenulatum TaxID=28026 RepID=UPI00321BC009
MWFKVDDSFYSNPKTAMLSDGATALWLRSGSWSAQQLTGGFVPARMVPMFRGSNDSVRELCDAGLWAYDEQKDGYQFHDWSDYQPDGEEVDALRKKRSEAGKRGANRRWGKPENGKNGKTDGKCHGKPMANAWQDDGKSMANVCPVPVPVPEKKEKEEYSSSFSKETTADEYLETGRTEADRQISRQYPNLDLTDAWGAFIHHHHGETRTIADWTRLWKGWCQRRANMSGIPQKTPHTHTWACEHTLKRLGIKSRDDVQDMTKAQQTANQLNKEDRNGRT